MYHYINNFVSQSESIKHREPISIGAGFDRVMFIAKAINEETCIVSMGAGKKKGFFKKVIEKHSLKIKIIYLPQWHITFFKKKLRHIFYSFFLLLYLVREVKSQDTLILYNGSKSFFMIIPVLVFKIFRKTKYILEIEELYSYKRKKNMLSFSENISIKYASGYVIVNNNIRKFIYNQKPTLLNAGYFSYEYNILADYKENNNKNLQIIYSGRLDKGSGIEIFLESLKFITTKCSVVITGKGELASYVNSFENSNPLIDFKYLGLLNNKDYHELLCNTQIAVNPIWVKNDFTDVSFPSKVLQYLAYGLQVVSSNIKALDVLNGLRENIYIYNNDSSLQLAEQVNRLLRSGFSNRSLIIEETKKYFDNSTNQLKEFISNI